MDSGGERGKIGGQTDWRLGLDACLPFAGKRRLVGGEVTVEAGAVTR